MLTESLTVSITADSTALESELTRLATRVAGFDAELQSLIGSASRVGTALADTSAATGPLSEVSSLVTGIASQLQTIAATPLTIDATAAVASLQQVTAAAQVAAAAVQTVGVASAAALATAPSGGMPAMPGPSGGAPMPPGFAGPIPKLASGGRVEGASGIDQVPAMLSRGEFVLREPSARRFPPGLLDQLNSVGPAALPQTSAPQPATATPSQIATDRTTATHHTSDRERVVTGTAASPSDAAVESNDAPAAGPVVSPVVAAGPPQSPSGLTLSPDPISPPVAAASAMPAASSPTPPAESSGVQFVGDIYVQVTQPIEVGEVLRQLEVSRLRDQTRHG